MHHPPIASPDARPKQPGSVAPASCLPPWNEVTVRHLHARAGFGASAEEIEEALRTGPEQTVERLMQARVPWEDVEPVLVRWEKFDLGPDQVRLKQSMYATPEEAHASKARWRAIDREQFNVHTERWFQSMLEHSDPLRDRATLFWHGVFTTSSFIVKRKYEIIRQHQWLRRESLGSFKRLLHGLVRDPAMLQYLDNNTNVRGHPNENFARELMELYSLGEGNYTEVDVREAARALTGSTGDPEGQFRFKAETHDDGEKTILRRTGKLGGEELVDILLAQPACATFVAKRLLAWFEGEEPSAARLEEYASFLREREFELEPWFRKLFLDPRFYREEIVGARVQGPIEFLVSFCRKTHVKPPPEFIYRGSSLLGQTFYGPLTVRGWSEGLDWITNDSLMQRGNAVGALLDILLGEEAAAEDAGMAEGPAMSEPTPQGQPEPAAKPGATVQIMLNVIHKAGWQSNADLAGEFERAGARDDARIVDHACARWLAVPVDDSTRNILIAYVAKQREVARQQSDARAAWEMGLRRFARLLFSLPEAQLN